MRRLVCSAVLLLLICGCKKREPIQTEPTDETGATLLSSVKVADPRAAIQLLKGFHQVEHNAWRWTERQFVVSLKTPSGAADTGAVLTLKGSAPPPVLEKHGAVTLAAKVGDQTLGSATYNSPGDVEFSAPVPASMLKESLLTVEFTVDKALPPGSVDLRELGFIVASISLKPQ